MEDLKERRFLVLRDSIILEVDGRLTSRDLAGIGSLKYRLVGDADKMMAERLLRSRKGEMADDLTHPGGRFGAACGIPPGMT